MAETESKTPAEKSDPLPTQRDFSKPKEKWIRTISMIMGMAIISWFILQEIIKGCIGC